MIAYILALICGVAILLTDQLTKHVIISNFALGESADFLKGFIDLIYIHNRGGAWGMLSGHTWILLVVSAVLMLICIVMLFKSGKKSKLLFWAVTLVFFGGVGNMIDRIFRNGNVIDFLHFEFWPNFPVFNVADCGIVIGAGLLILYFIIDFINEKKNNTVAETDQRQETDGNNRIGL